MPAKFIKSLPGKVRVEVQTIPAIHNYIVNPSGEDGYAWGWTTPTTAALTTGASGTPAVPYLQVTAANPQYEYAETEKIAITGTKIGGRLNVVSYSTSVLPVTWFRFYNAAGGVVSDSASTNWTSSGFRYLAETNVPAGAVYVTMLVIVRRTGNINPVAGDYVRFRYAMLVQSNATIGTTYNYVEPFQFTDVFSSVTDITVDRKAFDSGLLSVRLVDAALNPSTNALLRPGKVVRLMAQHPTSGEWAPFYYGKISGADVTYRRKRRQNIGDKGTVTIDLKAVDGFNTLAQSASPQSVLGIANLPDVLEGKGLRWNCDGWKRHITATPVAIIDNAKTVDQLALTRDTAQGYVWIDRFGVVQAWTNYGTAEQAYFTDQPSNIDPSYLRDIDVNLNTDRVVNNIYFKVVQADGSELTYGPWVNAPSMAQWGPRAVTYTGLVGINADTVAAAVFAAQANPVDTINSLTMPVKDAMTFEHATRLDIYDAVQVTYGSLVHTVRITGIKHSITTDSWTVDYTFDTVDGSPAPIVLFRGA